MIKIGKKPRQLADRSDAIDTGLRPSRTEGRGETTGRPVRFRVRPSSSLPAPLRSGTGFVPSPEPSLRGAVRSSPPAPLDPSRGAALAGGRKRLPLRGFLELIARSAASAPHALRHRLRSGPAPFRPRSVQAPSPQAPPEPSLRGAFTARSLCCAGAFARRASAPPLAPNRSLPCSRLPSLRGAVTAVTEGCCQRLRSVCNFLLLLLFRAFFRHAAPPL